MPILLAFTSRCELFAWKLKIAVRYRIWGWLGEKMYWAHLIAAALPHSHIYHKLHTVSISLHSFFSVHKVQSAPCSPRAISSEAGPGIWSQHFWRALFGSQRTYAWSGVYWSQEHSWGTGPPQDSTGDQEPYNGSVIYLSSISPARNVQVGMWPLMSTFCFILLHSEFCSSSQWNSQLIALWLICVCICVCVCMHTPTLWEFHYLFFFKSFSSACWCSVSHELQCTSVISMRWISAVVCVMPAWHAIINMNAGQP